MTGDPNARIEISTEGRYYDTKAKATLVWDETKKAEMERYGAPDWKGHAGKLERYELTYVEVETTTVRKLEVGPGTPLSKPSSVYPPEERLADAFVKELQAPIPTNVVSRQRTGKEVKVEETCNPPEPDHVPRPGGDW